MLLSDVVEKLLSRLYLLKRNWRWSLTPDCQLRLRVVNELAETGDISAVLPLVQFLKLDPVEFSSAASLAIQRLVSELDAEQLLVLEQDMRQWTHYEYGVSTDWHFQKPGEVATWNLAQEARPTIYGLASFHPNGYVREQAVKLLAEAHRGDEIPFLALRANDWVEPIRGAAQRALQERFDNGESEPAVRRHYYLFLRLLDSPRNDTAAFIHRLIAKLLSPTHRDQLAALVAHENRRVRRLTFRVATSTAGEHREFAIREGLRSADTAVRQFAARCAREHLSADVLRTLLPAFEADSVPDVRYEALMTVVTRLPELAEDRLSTYLWSKSRALRTAAQFYLRRNGALNLADRYRQGLANVAQLYIAILGLGETGAEDDVERLVPFVDHPLSRVRAAAIQAISSLDRSGKSLLGRGIALLADASPAVSRSASAALMDLAGSVDTDSVGQLATRHPLPHVRKSAFRLLGESPFWPAAAWMLEIATGEDQAAAHARNWLMTRTNRVFTIPKSVERERLTIALDKHRLRLPSWLVDAVELALRRA